MDVKLPDGTIVTNVPEGITQSQLMARLGKRSPLQPFNTNPNGPSISAAPDDPDSFSKMAEQVHQQAQAVENQSPWIERGSTQRAALPVAGGLIGGLGPGLVVSSLLAGGGSSLGEFFAQKLVREPTDTAKIAKTGGASAVGNFVGGAVIKGLTSTARKLFASPLDDAAKAGAQFARDSAQPFPLSSAVPGSPASRVQQSSRLLLPGELKTQADANKVAQFLNREVSTIQANGSPIDEAALKGQQFLRQVFEPGETIYTQTFKSMRESVGDAAAIPLTNTMQTLQGVADALKTRGATGALAQHIQTLAKRPASQMTAQQIDDLYGELLKKAGKNPNARAEMNVVLSAIVKDVDDFGKQFGMSFADDIGKAKAVRDEFRELRKIPGLDRLAKDFGSGGAAGSRQWMAELFGNPNGKAMAELRARNPELYHELADSWLASNISKFSRSSETAVGNVLDGRALRGWYEQNADKLKLIYGTQQAKALDNFSNYAALMSGSVSRATRSSFDNPASLMLRAGGEIAATAKAPILMVPGEAGSYVLAKGLSDPNSVLFRLFTEGVKPGTMKFLETSAKFSGQRHAENER